MIGLIFSAVLLFLTAALLGFAAGYRLRAEAASVHQRALEADIEALRRDLSEAQVRRARG